MFWILTNYCCGGSDCFHIMNACPTYQSHGRIKLIQSLKASSCQQLSGHHSNRCRSQCLKARSSYCCSLSQTRSSSRHFLQTLCLSRSCTAVLHYTFRSPVGAEDDRGSRDVTPLPENLRSCELGNDRLFYGSEAWAMDAETGELALARHRGTMQDLGKSRWE